VSSVFNAVKGVVTSIFNATKGVVTSIWNSMVTVITSALNRAKSAVSGAISTIKGYFSGAGSWLYDAGKQLIQGLVNGIKAMIGAVTGAISGIASKIKGFMPGSPIKEGPLKPWNTGRPGEQLINMVADGIRSNLAPIEEAFNGLAIPVPTVLASPEVAVTASAQRTASAAQAPAQPSVDLASLIASGDLGTKEINVEYKVYNPVAEKSSESAVRETTRMSELGVFG
jgi:hypothetical protein